MYWISWHKKILVENSRRRCVVLNGMLNLCFRGICCCAILELILKILKFKFKCACDNNYSLRPDGFSLFLGTEYKKNEKLWGKDKKVGVVDETNNFSIEKCAILRNRQKWTGHLKTESVRKMMSTLAYGCLVFVCFNDEACYYSWILLKYFSCTVLLNYWALILLINWWRKFATGHSTRKLCIVYLFSQQFLIPVFYSLQYCRGILCITPSCWSICYQL